MREDDGVEVLAQAVDLPAQVKTGKRFADGSSHGFSLSGFGRRPPTPRLRAGQFGRRRVNATSTRGRSSQNAPPTLLSSEQRRAWKVAVSTWRSRWSP